MTVTRNLENPMAGPSRKDAPAALAILGRLPTRRALGGRGAAFRAGRGPRAARVPGLATGPGLRKTRAGDLSKTELVVQRRLRSAEVAVDRRVSA